MRRILIVILLLTCCIRLSAGIPPELMKHIDAGFEWGYSATICNNYHYNYLSEVSGSRVDTRDKDYTYKSNGHLCGYVGARLLKYFTTDIVFGWVGVYEDRRVQPLTLRLSWYTNGFDRDGIKLFYENGTFFGAKKSRSGSFLSKAGVGRRVILGEYIALDASLSAQFVSDHPLDVFDKQMQVSVPNANLRRSDCRYTSINFSLALSF